MKGYYEVLREQDERLNIQFKRHSKIIPHFHANIEIFAVKRGKHEVCCNGVNYVLSDGDCAFFDGYDVHGYEVPEISDEDCVLIIPPKYATRFNEERKKPKILSPVFHSPETVNAIMEITERAFLNPKSESILRAAIDLLFAIVSEKLVYGDEDDAPRDIELVGKMLSFFNEKFKDGIKLKDAAKHLGYSEEHLSRVFHRYFGRSVPSYINELRLDYVEKRKATGNEKITDLIYEAGFSGVQTYYRNKNKSDKK